MRAAEVPVSDGRDPDIDRGAPIGARNALGIYRDRLGGWRGHLGRANICELSEEVCEHLAVCGPDVLAAASQHRHRDTGLWHHSQCRLVAHGQAGVADHGANVVIAQRPAEAPSRLTGAVVG